MEREFIYKNSFQELIKDINVSSYVGRGNPNAEILFVGKENSKKNEFDAKYWKEKIDKNEKVNLSHPRKGGNPTWKNYQKLYNYIFNKPVTDILDFEENIFTTEMSEVCCKKTKQAQGNPEFKSKLEFRKNTFFKSKFVKEFPVVVLACSNYIDNVNKKEINEIFGVEYKDVITYEKKVKNIVFGYILTLMILN